MHIRFLLGPAGSGKTFRCLAEIRELLTAAPDGAPLVFVAPKQATFQLERQLLSDPRLRGYSRLRILSFERLAEFVFDELQLARPTLLSDLGRLMVLRALLARESSRLKLFHGTAHLPGFARQLSLQLREFQRYRFSPATVSTLAAKNGTRPELHAKLHDLAILFEAYLRWLEEHGLQDIYRLPDLAAAALSASARSRGALPATTLKIAGLWLDGFAEMTPQELSLIEAIVPFCDRATLAFCIDATGQRREDSWLSHWSAVGRTFEECRQRLERGGDAVVSIENLPRRAAASRFALSPPLAHLEEFWSDPKSFGNPGESIRLIACANPEAEATLAAQEIRRFARNGGRYRDTAVIVRDLDRYRQALERAFRRFEIPCFVDQREPAAHHPLAELTRGAVRTVAFDWRQEDWFGTLKTGLAAAEEAAVDRLENEAMARGWTGRTWRAPIRLPDQPELESQLERWRRRILPPFEAFEARLAGSQFRPNGRELADALRALWRDLNIEQQLQSWASGPAHGSGSQVPNTVHATVWDQMNEWLDMVGLAFTGEALPLREWLPILEAGLAELTVGVVPPSLDQVLVGAVDRSRNPDLKLAIVLGLNESVFPAPPAPETLLTEEDRDELGAQHQPRLGPELRRRLSQERYLGYIAFTRPRENLVLSYSDQDGDGQPLNPSTFVMRVQRLFPELKTERFPVTQDWRAAEHVSELLPALLRGEAAVPARLESQPQIQSALARWRQWLALPGPGELALSPAAVRALYGTELRSSVSALEQFAACPFQFFVNYGLHAGERRRFEADPRQTGSFQHEILSQFHQRLQKEGKRWRDLSAAQAREYIGEIGEELASTFAGGLFLVDAKSRFLAGRLIEQLQDYIAAMAGWMGQYQFDPAAVELEFGLKSDHVPPWRLDLENGGALLLRGKIDRVDLCCPSGADSALAVVIDYKSGRTTIDATLLEHGLQLQLFSYVGALRRLKDPMTTFGVPALSLVGGFYVPLRASASSRGTRSEVLAETEGAAAGAFLHTGRFDATALPRLDSSGARQGTQFHYSKKIDGGFKKIGNEAMPSAEFFRLLDKIERDLRRHAQNIFSGSAAASPYRKGNLRACAKCACQTICRFDPWIHPFRVLRKSTELPEMETASEMEANEA